MPLVKYGGVLMKMRSPASSPSVRATCPALLETALSVWRTPLGSPVVPDVNMIIAISSSVTALSSSGGSGRSSFAAGRAHAVHEAVCVGGDDEPHGTVVRRRAGRVVRHHDDVRPGLADQPVHVVLRQARVERDDDLPGEPGAQHADEELVVLLKHERDAGAAPASGGQE